MSYSDQIYHEYFADCCYEAESKATALQIEFDCEGPGEKLWTGGVSYGQTITEVFPIKTIKGKATKKVMVFTVYRLESGRYELNCYVS